MPSNCSAAAARTRAEARPYGDAVELTVDQVPGLGTRDWIAVTERELPAGRALAWASVPDCGAVVSFCGTVRDHSPGRPEVSSLEYEVHPDSAVPRLAEVAAAAPLVVGEVSVVVVASTPHRAEAFDAAEYCIDTLKRTVPIWKRETWSGGSDWSACDHEIEDVGP